METVPNREQSRLVGNGVLLVSAPRNRAEATSPKCGKYGWAGVQHIESGLEVGPPSNVTIRAYPSLIREGALLPPLVGRCLTGREVFQKQRTGRVAQVGAARSLEGVTNGRAHCKAVVGSFLCPFGDGHERTTKERTGNTQHQQRPLLVEGNAPWEGSQCGYLRLSLASGPQVATSGDPARAEKEERRFSVVV